MSMSSESNWTNGADQMPLMLARPPALASIDCAVIAPVVSVVPAAAWKIPVETGPLMVIDPPVATGSSARGMDGSKLSMPPRVDEHRHIRNIDPAGGVCRDGAGADVAAREEQEILAGSDGPG